MNFDRILPTIDVDAMQQSKVIIVGGAYGLARDLVRCGLGSITLIDYDRVDASNPPRQDFYSTDLGLYKMEATRADLKRINPDVEVSVHLRDFCSISAEEFESQYGDADLIVMATDFFPASARANQESLRLDIPVVYISLYGRGRAGEIIWYIPGHSEACYRCIASPRYKTFMAGGVVNVPSVGGTILDLRLVDAIAGHVAVGILTRGADNRMGRLIDQLGQRNLLQVKIDPEYRLGDRDIFAERLGDSPANFSFTTIALQVDAEPDCPDCAHLRASQRV